MAACRFNEAGPPRTMSFAGIAARTSVGLMYVVGRLDPFQRTADVVTNPLPTTVTLKLGPPAVVAAGASDVTVGTGFVTAKDSVPETPPAGTGLKIEIDGVPPAAISLAAIDA